MGPPPPGQPAPLALTRAGRAHVLVLGAVTVGAAMPFYLRVGGVHNGWISFALLATATTFAQVFPVKSPQNVVYQTSIVFLFAATLVLRPELLVLIPLVMTLPRGVRERYPLPIEMSNIANYTLSALAAWGTADLIRYHEGTIASPNVRFAVAGLAACAAFVAANHAIVALTLHFVRGHELEATGIFTLDSFTIDLVLSTLGLTLAAFWIWNPWLAFAAIAPLLVVHRSMSIPQLQEEARVDPKTGLYNARYFAATLQVEIARAERFDRPMAVIMADLDLLREINNNFGHLAGDAVLRGVAEIFRSQLRHYDVPARFGGEEFSILLPETPPAQAYEIAERIRRTVAESRFEVDTAEEPLRATVSVGVATYPDDGLDANQLIHSADLAVYRAKLQGRNRVFGAGEEAFFAGSPHAAHLRVVEPLPAVQQRLREAAETIQTQNVSLERANRLLRERTTAAMESLSATVDARDAYTAGHSRPRPGVGARNRSRARPLARRARGSGSRGSLPRHRQARGAGRHPPEAKPVERGGVGPHAHALGGGSPHHRASRLSPRRGSVDPPSPRVVRRCRLPRRVGGGGDPARRADHPRRGRTRLDGHHPQLPARPPERGGAA